MIEPLALLALIASFAAWVVLERRWQAGRDVLPPALNRRRPVHGGQVLLAFALYLIVQIVALRVVGAWLGIELLPSGQDEATQSAAADDSVDVKVVPASSDKPAAETATRAGDSKDTGNGAKAGNGAKTGNGAKAGNNVQLDKSDPAPQADEPSAAKSSDSTDDAAEEAPSVSEDDEHLLIELLQKKPGVLTYLLCFLSAVIAAPLVEELFFRGLLLRWLEGQEPQLRRVFPPFRDLPFGSIAIGLSAIPFALLHIRGKSTHTVEEIYASMLALTLANLVSAVLFVLILRIRRAIPEEAVADGVPASHGHDPSRSQSSGRSVTSQHNDSPPSPFRDAANPTVPSIASRDASPPSTADAPSLIDASLPKRMVASVRIGTITFLLLLFPCHGLQLVLTALLPSDAPPADPAPLFLFAVIQGVVALRTRSTLPTILSHALFNLVALIAALSALHAS